MKKVIAVILSIGYLFLSMGMMLNMHYCQGKLESISLISEKNSCCCMAMDANSGCCDNKQVFIQFDNDEQVISSSIQVVEFFKYIDSSFDILDEFALEDTEIEYFTYTDISPPPKLSIWKKNCSFLFYG